ncbi:MotA/TolQ/ExbB proton channel family protein [Bacteroidota bacterium]
MKSLLEKFNDGGPVFSYIILIVILIIIGLLVKAFINRDNKKEISLLASFGWFALAWGYLGRTFGLIMAFDNIAAAGEIAPSVVAPGLKMALIGPLLGLIAFIIARIGILTLRLIAKREAFES